VYGMPGQALYELVRSPYELLENPDLHINYEYYVMKQILPPLDRIMCLLNVNVFEWIKTVSFKPKVFQYLAEGLASSATTNTISNFIFSTDCVLCGSKRELKGAKNYLCKKCSALDQSSLAKLKLKFQKCELRLQNLIKICQLCTSNQYLNINLALVKNECSSLDCPNTFLLSSSKQDFKKSDYVRKVIDEYF
jgi:DNA polymerase zeta